MQYQHIPSYPKTHSLPPRYRELGHLGVLGLVSTKCPALLDLTIADLHLDQPTAPLVHLTSLSMIGCKALFGDGDARPLRLATAAPQLEVLSWDSYPPVARATGVVQGHSCLRRLELRSIDMYDDSWMFGEEEEDGERPAERWFATARALPALTSLAFQLRGDEFFDAPDLEGDAGRAAHLMRVCGWLGHCKRLADLELTVGCLQCPIQVLLAAVGATLGDRLRSLTLVGAKSPPDGSASRARALHTLVACYSHLEVLTLKLSSPRDAAPLHDQSSDDESSDDESSDDDGDAGVREAEEQARELVLPAAELAALCPALRKVHVEPHERCANRGARGACWVRGKEKAVGKGCGLWPVTAAAEPGLHTVFSMSCLPFGMDMSPAVDAGMCCL